MPVNYTVDHKTTGVRMDKCHHPSKRRSNFRRRCDGDHIPIPDEWGHAPAPGLKSEGGALREHFLHQEQQALAIDGVINPLLCRKTWFLRN